ncbi:MAG: DUF3081 family protein [Gammaproteobacteria bacterium]|nr:DUF3081 family protein [Gammaproteobacteria bacterium]
MKNELDIHKILKAFQKVIKHGTKRNDYHILNGIKAQSDFDGYTVILSNDDVELTIFFHNRYDLKSKNKFAQKEFFEKIEVILKRDYQ